jgi:hypothetical protein
VLHDYLFRKYQLLNRVIRARKLHHSHFFAIDNDYGHAKYLDKLQNERLNMVRALERLGRRAAKFMYEQKEWYTWIKHCQEKEDKEAENESKKVKLESLLFKRHQKEIDRHKRQMRSREDRKRQEQYLNAVCVQRLSEMSEGEQDEWDPIQDVYSYEKDNYVDLIKFFLTLDVQDQIKESPADDKTTQGSSSSKPAGKILSKSARKRARRANADTKETEDDGSNHDDKRSSDNDGTSGDNHPDDALLDSLMRKLDTSMSIKSLIVQVRRVSSLDAMDYFLPALRNPSSEEHLPPWINEHPAALMSLLKRALRGLWGDDPNLTREENMTELLLRLHDRHTSRSMSSKA